MNKLKNPDEEWTLMDVEKIGERAINEIMGDMTHNAVSFSNSIFPSLKSKIMGVSILCSSNNF